MDTSSDDGLRNRLGGEGSLYLRQHAGNPVHWQPWDDEALEAARRLRRPIFVSVGYSSCHWCHVMEHEVFESPAVADLLNRHFVSIKVDREERPDIDRTCMAALVAMAGQGGWPTSLFLTEDLHPFYAATYVPEPQFRGLLARIHSVWEEDRGNLRASAVRIANALSPDVPGPTETRRASAPDPAGAARSILEYVDDEWGGLRGATKFPMVPLWTFLLHAYRREADPDLGRAVRLTLDRMADGGMRDHAGGGFHRYAVDRAWTVPHFEKMLSDNALLAGLYLEASVVFPDAGYAAVAAETLDFLLDELRLPSGGFAASLDADDPVGEGAYYTWRRDEVLEAAGADGARLAEYLCVTDAGPVDGRCVLTRRSGPPMPPEALRRGLADLARARQARPRPTLDTKVIAGWNGLAIAALARGHRLLGAERYREGALAAAGYLLTAHRLDDGRLVRATTDGRPAGEAVLEDYAMVAAGLLEFSQSAGTARWYAWARGLVDAARERFRDGEGRWFDVTPGERPLPFGEARTAGDTALPGPLATLAGCMHWIGLIEADDSYCAEAEALSVNARAAAGADAIDAASWLDLALRWAGPAYAVRTGLRDGSGAALWQAASHLGASHVLLIPAGSEGDSDEAPSAVACRRGACEPPQTDPTRLTELLSRGWAC